MKPKTLCIVAVLMLLALALGGCGQADSTLRLEEHALASAPQPDPLRFQPNDGTQQEILAKHALPRSLTFSAATTTLGGNPAISSLGESGDLTAVLLTSAQGQPSQTVRVMRAGELLLQVDAGMPSPVLPLQGLWAYDGHWALEILLADQSNWMGEVFIDGELVNKQKGYDEAFGFQLLSGKPFFFFHRNGYIGYSYDGQETELTYTDIPHYRCCGESSLNPVQAQSMVAFFAERDQAWFYVELGTFK